jgi:hypothetical protein
MSCGIRLTLIIVVTFISTGSFAAGAPQSGGIEISSARAVEIRNANAAGCLAPPGTLARVRTVVAEAETSIGRGDLAAARTRIETLDASADYASASPEAQALFRWRVVNRAIDRGLDRALMALQADHRDPKLSETALADLLAAVDQIAATPHESARGKCR